jgi:hypothetical protein
MICFYPWLILPPGFLAYIVAAIHAAKDHLIR